MGKNLLERLEGLKEYTDNELEDYVIDYVLENYDTPESAENFILDVQEHGCVSGIVNELISYYDTIQFYDEYKKEINYLLSKTLSSTGLSIKELFGDKWDEDDPLALERINQNLLAWFGFEETLSKIWNVDLN
ncbi:MAG: DUF7222 domain-containing protein [Elusimicrobiota bacterium]